MREIITRIRLIFTSNIRRKKTNQTNPGLCDFDRGVVVGARRAGSRISDTVDGSRVCAERFVTDYARFEWKCAQHSTGSASLLVGDCNTAEVHWATESAVMIFECVSAWKMSYRNLMSTTAFIRHQNWDSWWSTAADDSQPFLNIRLPYV